MSKKYLNKYRIGSWRHPDWDYSEGGAYFITICTKDRREYLGEIIEVNNNRKIKYTEIGNVAFRFWQNIPEHFPFVKLDSFVIMPNHIHGILLIYKPDVDAQNFAHLPFHIPDNFNGNKNKFAPQSKNLASIIRGYKAGVKTYAVNKNIDFNWQRRFHDRIIRNNLEYQRIKKYINLNIDHH